jgi:hypothetical protein
MEKQGMKNFVKIAIAAAALVAPMQAQAANVEFNASVDNSCAIVVNNGGTMVQNGAATELDSASGGGTPASITVSATSTAFGMSYAAPTAWEAASTGTTAASYAVTADAYTPAVGDVDLEVNLKATATAGTFETGSYVAIVVATCE